MPFFKCENNIQSFLISYHSIQSEPTSSSPKPSRLVVLQCEGETVLPLGIEHRSGALAYSILRAEAFLDSVFRFSFQHSLYFSFFLLYYCSTLLCNTDLKQLYTNTSPQDACINEFSLISFCFLFQILLYHNQPLLYLTFTVTE